MGLHILSRKIVNKRVIKKLVLNDKVKPIQVVPHYRMKRQVEQITTKIK